MRTSGSPGAASHSRSALTVYRGHAAEPEPLVPVAAQKRAHALGERLLRAGQDNVDAEALGVRALGQAQGVIRNDASPSELTRILRSFISGFTINFWIDGVTPTPTHGT